MKIFVYGTLMRGFGNWRYLMKGRTKFIGVAATDHSFTLTSGGYAPGMIPGNSVVLGEVFEFDDAELLADLDRLEGHPRNYIRTPITVMLESGEPVDVETYVYQYDGLPVVESGDWRKHTGTPIGTSIDPVTSKREELSTIR